MTITMKVTKELIADAKKVEEFKQQLMKLCREYDVSLMSSDEIVIEKNNEIYELANGGKFPKD